jgi:peptidoglycan hydrolase-like protein with peptidoglycan-binding domain
MASVKIKKSVGKNGKNDADDAKKIQELLNAHKTQGGYAALAVDGDVGKKTIAAITAFQSKVMGVKADGRVDVDGATLAALNARPGTVGPAPDPAPSSGGSSKKKPSSTGGSGKSSAKVSEVEKRIAAAREAIEETSSGISDQETISSNLRKREQFLDQLRLIAPERIKAAKAALEAADDQSRQAALQEVLDAATRAAQCMAESEADARSIAGAKCEEGLGKAIVNYGRLLLDDRVSKVAAKLDATVVSMDRTLTLAIGALKAVRIANEAYILVLKGKRLLHEKALEMAEKELKAQA